MFCSRVHSAACMSHGVAAVRPSDGSLEHREAALWIRHELPRLEKDSVLSSFGSADKETVRRPVVYAPLGVSVVLISAYQGAPASCCLACPGTTAKNPWHSPSSLGFCLLRSGNAPILGRGSVQPSARRTARRIFGGTIGCFPCARDMPNAGHAGHRLAQLCKSHRCSTLARSQHTGRAPKRSRARVSRDDKTEANGIFHNGVAELPKVHEGRRVSCLLKTKVPSNVCRRRWAVDGGRRPPSSSSHGKKKQGCRKPDGRTGKKKAFG
ncbi:hypothetical protein B0T22DRAFT_471625 [Podospora appendiculata]|uniref:Uncharacterized protein n=1 Tax=Podospora appendiculata TaxID=314037 RepID=A0AAE0X1T0_9PEZI|nr:hypothetical protein B0T22DRAFT_471625 [Podospora appendiculata]